MTLLFVHFCHLLEALERIATHDPPFLPADRHRKNTDVIRNWMSSHRTKVEPQILLSALFPSKRTDRVYSIQCKRLCRQLGRFLSLGHARFQELNKYLVPGHGDLGQCVERVQRQSEFHPPPASKALTLQQIENAFDLLASRSFFSSKDIRACSLDSDRNVLTLESIYKLLQSWEMKWLTRLLLKDFGTIDMASHTHLMYSCIDSRLTLAMQMYDNIAEAVRALPEVPYADSMEPASSALDCEISNVLSPQIGTKVGPARWLKAKGGIDHALSLIGPRLMSVERKYDGEYCQIHVDLDREDGTIQIFSKSGKDSTEDRQNVLPALEEGLRISQTNRKFSKKCILEGELVVWSDRDSSILEFHKLRKHVPRSGLYIGIKEDSQPHSWEHLMLVFFDILLLDDDAILHKPQNDRRWLLEQVVEPVPGRIVLASRTQIDFSKQADASYSLKIKLAEAFAKRWEGLVLKPAAEPYFGPAKGPPGSRSPWIKLKKDCIAGFGDSADFAVIGAGYDAKRAQQVGLHDIRWTHFFLGCLTNKLAVLESNADPCFMVVDCVTDCISREDFRMLNQQGPFQIKKKEEGLHQTRFGLDFLYMNPRLPTMTTTFPIPLVFDVAGSGFECGSNRKLYTLRFPRVIKIRWDADWRNCVDLDQLQSMAREAQRPPQASFEEEISTWKANLDRSNTSSKLPAIQGQSSSEVSDVAAPTNRSMSNRRRLEKNSKPPTFVRTDTNELREGEKRPDYSAITVSHILDVSAISAEEPHSAHSKQSAAEGTKGIVTRNAGKKRQYTEFSVCSSPSSSARWSSHNVEPLKEIPSLANSRMAAGFPRITVGEGTGDCYLDLVRKHATGIESSSRYPKRRQIRYIRSSPDVETTTDECSSAGSTQIRTLYALVSQPSPKRGRTHVHAAGLATLSSTAEGKSPISLPDMENLVAFADSSSRQSERLRRFYGKYRLGLKGILQPIHQLYSPSASFYLEPSKKVIFLVDSKNIQQATQNILDITACTVKIRRAVTIWDWRILQWLVNKGTKSAVEEKAWSKMCLASMVPENEADGSYARGITVSWHDGVTEHVSAAKVDRLGKQLRVRLNRSAVTQKTTCPSKSLERIEDTYIMNS